MKPLLVSLFLLTALPARAYDLHRKTTTRDLAVELERYQLPNGLTVLLAPDPSVSSVMVEMTFRAGALFEPPGRSGMAHLIEHLMASGPTKDTDYLGLLEKRHARYFNAETEFETMSFQTLVPAEELPVALWVAADRLGSVPPLLTDAEVERNRLVVLQERNLRDVDAPFGLTAEKLFAALFPPPHPLHGMVLGRVDELEKVTADDARAFVKTYLVPANAILTVVGRFEPAQAKALVEKSFAALPPGKRARLPEVKELDQNRSVTADEQVARSPSEIEAWRVRLSPGQADALQLGAQLLSLMMDGAFGMRLEAQLMENEGESIFLAQLVVPWNDPQEALASDMVGYIRFFTMRQAPLEMMEPANLALDRAALFDLETLDGRARRLTQVERLRPGTSVAAGCAAHWQLDPGEIRSVAQTFLQSPHATLFARPARPRPERPGRRIQ